MAEDSEDVKARLRECLEVIGGGHFATSGLLPNANNPGLFVHNLGKVGLPLSDRDAGDIARVAHEAPFGKGSETFVDRRETNLGAESQSIRVAEPSMEFYASGGCQ